MYVFVGDRETDRGIWNAWFKYQYSWHSNGWYWLIAPDYDAYTWVRASGYKDTWFVLDRTKEYIYVYMTKKPPSK
jgi:hypothetical protein